MSLSLLVGMTVSLNFKLYLFTRLQISVCDQKTFFLIPHPKHVICVWVLKTTVSMISKLSAFYPSENFACIPSKVIDRISNVTQAVTLPDAPPRDINDDGADRVMILYVFATQIFHESAQMYKRNDKIILSVLEVIT